MKKYPHYRKTLKNGAKKAVDNLEEMFQKQWDMNKENLKCGLRRKAGIIEDYVYNDETLNNGDIIECDNFEDEIYND